MCLYSKVVLCVLILKSGGDICSKISMSYLFIVEHYERKAVRYYDEGPRGEEELRVSSANRTQDYVKKAAAILEVCLFCQVCMPVYSKQWTL